MYIVRVHDGNMAEGLTGRKLKTSRHHVRNLRLMCCCNCVMGQNRSREHKCRRDDISASKILKYQNMIDLISRKSLRGKIPSKKHAHTSANAERK